MIRSMILSALATAALAVTGPALAKPGKSGGHGRRSKAGAKAGKAEQQCQERWADGQTGTAAMRGRRTHRRPSADAAPAEVPRPSRGAAPLRAQGRRGRSSAPTPTASSTMTPLSRAR